MQLGYTIQTTPEEKKAAVEKWALRHNAVRSTYDYRNVSQIDREYSTGMMTQDERYDYETQEKSYPYTNVEYTVSEPTDQCRKEFFVVRGYLADIKNDADLKAIGYR